MVVIKESVWGRQQLGLVKKQVHGEQLKQLSTECQ
jgi:hypothetical protein